jgi:NTE family protein
MSEKTKVAIACQGGGAQNAFTAGALKALFESDILDRVRIVSLSGTSGGAICATSLWYSLIRGDKPVWKRTIDLWKDNTARYPGEILYNRLLVSNLELATKGLLPVLHPDPYSEIVKYWINITRASLREEFIDIRKLLEKNIDFDDIRARGSIAGPVLLLGARDVLSGELWKFNSRRETIDPEKVIASCAVPTIFEAVKIDGSAYWDGILSDNPPVDELLDPDVVGEENIPDEIWIIKLNPTEREKIPDRPRDILDRHNELGGDVSLFHDLSKIEMLNDLFLRDAFKTEFLEHYPIRKPVKIPKSFPSQQDKSYHIPWIAMSPETRRGLYYESKFDRSPEYVRSLMEDGEKQAKQFLAARFEG